MGESERKREREREREREWPMQYPFGHYGFDTMLQDPLHLLFMLAHLYSHFYIKTSYFYIERERMANPVLTWS